MTTFALVILFVVVVWALFAQIDIDGNWPGDKP